MRRPVFPLLIPLLLLLLCAARPSAAQKFQPKSIQFKGDPEYSDQELLDAAGLKKGTVLTSAEMNDHSKLLMDSGVFDNLTYKFDGADLIFSLTPAELMYPIRLENLPLTVTGKDLDTKLHDRLPLYHGKVPSEGTLLDSVRAALEDLLAAQGIKATVSATPFGVAGTRKVSAMNFSITTPLVRVGALQLQGVSPDFQARVQAIADHATGSPFDTENSASNLEHAFQMFYADEGYAGAKAHAVRSGGPVIGAAAVDIPYSVTVDSGPLYKLGAIHLPADSLVTQADIDKITGAQAGLAKGVTVRSIWEMIANSYKSKGYMSFMLTPHPQFDEAAGSVSYAVDFNPGPVYHLGLVRFENVSDDLRMLLMRNWQMLPGDPFDNSYVARFVLDARKSDPALQRTLATAKVSYDMRLDPATHEVNLVIRLEKR
jgi:outer membrane protein assembly factor BamA